MNKQKGQIQVIAILLIVIVGIIVYTVFFQPDEKTLKTSLPQTPVYQKQDTIPSPEQEDSASSDQTPDESPPYRSKNQPSGQLPAETRKMLISLETDEKAVCRYNTVEGVSYYSMNRLFESTDLIYHSAQVTGLSEGQEYVYYIKCIDEHNNINADDFVISFTVKEPDDFTPPLRTNQYPTGDVLSDISSTVIGISTNEPAYCRYSLEQGTSYSSMRARLKDDGTKRYHTTTIAGLKTGQTYEFFVRCQDLSGNANTGDVMIFFRVEQDIEM